MSRRVFSTEFINMLVNLVLERERSLTEVALSHDIHPGVLSKWVKKAREQSALKSHSANVDSGDIRHLQQRIADLEEKVDLFRRVMEKHFQSLYSVEERIKRM